ncbi:MAG: YHS domain-containing (seleno)protein [Pseudomonadota bacterium]
MNLRKILLLPLFAAFVAFSAPAAMADKPETYTGRFSNLALQGYDTVAYFTVGEPVEGSDEFSTEYKGATWRFVSQENLDLFLGDPSAYAPQFGGYCAWAVAQGKTAKGDARHWHVTDGKLYLNFNKKINERWLGDRDNFIVEGNANWPTVLQ